MTSRTTSWSSTTRTVPLMRAVSPTGDSTGIPETGCGRRGRAVHTSFLLMRRARGRPVRRDSRIAEIAVRDAAPAQELAVGEQELVHAPVRRHRLAPREPVGLP